MRTLGAHARVVVVLATWVVLFGWVSRARLAVADDVVALQALPAAAALAPGYGLGVGPVPPPPGFTSDIKADAPSGDPLAPILPENLCQLDVRAVVIADAPKDSFAIVSTDLDPSSLVRPGDSVRTKGRKLSVRKIEAGGVELQAGETRAFCKLNH